VTVGRAAPVLVLAVGVAVGVARLAPAAGVAAAAPRPAAKPLPARCGEFATAELALARGSMLYAVIDVPGRRIQVKARGLVLRGFSIRTISSVGGVPPTGLRKLVGKRPLIEPAPRMPPRPEEAAAREAEAPERPLTVADMPARYRLAFEGELWILVRAGEGDTGWRAWQARAGALTDRVRAWGTVLGGRLAAARRRVLLLELTADDARALYWSLRPPVAVLFRVACP
jgi:hypothetical protein